MSDRARVTVAATVLVLAIAAVYAPAVSFGFLGLDDPRFVTVNEHIQRGLTWDNVRWAFTSTDIGFYCPITTISHMTDCQLYGMNPAGHHLTSLILHAASTILILLAFRRMTGALLPSFLVAALFALHPMHVEPVAWIAERKDMVCAFFWALTLLAYSRYVPSPTIPRYLAVLAASTLAMLAKPMAVTIPFTLLLLDVWPLARWSGARASRLILEKAPLLLPMAVVSLLTIHAQADIGAVGSPETFPLGERVANALYAYGAYVGKTLVPIHLAALYPFRHGSMPATPLLLGMAVLVGGTAVAVLSFKKRRYVIVGWLWFVGTLVPTIGLVHVGSQSMADRYTYVAHIGLFIIVAYGLAEALAGASARVRRVAAAGMVVVLATLGIVARAQVMTWKDDEALYRQILRVSPDAILAWFNLGNYYLGVKNDPAAAKELYEKALVLDPRYGDVHLRLGMALAGLGRGDEALSHLREAVRLKPHLAEARFALASALRDQHRFADAAEAFRGYLELAPTDWRAQVSLGLLEGELGDWEAAAAELESATRLAPDQAASWGLLGFAKLQRNDRQPAAEAFRRAIALDPRLPQPHYYLGLMAREAGDAETARKELETLRSIDPRLAASLENIPSAYD